MFIRRKNSWNCFRSTEGWAQRNPKDYLKQWRCKNWTKCRGTQKYRSVRTARLQCPVEGQSWVAPGSQLRVNLIARFGDWMKSQLNVYCWHEHSHVKNTSASNSWEWQGFPLVKAQILRNGWLLAKNSTRKNYQARLASFWMAVWSCSHPDSCPTEIPHPAHWDEWVHFLLHAMDKKMHWVSERTAHQIPSLFSYLCLSFLIALCYQPGFQNTAVQALVERREEC